MFFSDPLVYGEVPHYAAMQFLKPILSVLSSCSIYQLNVDLVSNSLQFTIIDDDLYTWES